MTLEAVERIPPQSIAAEQNVIGSLLLAPARLVDVMDILRPEDFYRREHVVIYAALLELNEQQKPIDVFLLAEWLSGKGLTDEAGGDAYLLELNSTQAGTANVRAYAKIVSDKAMLRRLVDTGVEITNEGWNAGNREASEVVASAAAKVAQLTQASARDGGLKFVRNSIGAAWEELVGRDAGTIDPGLPPPYANVRDKLPGLEATDFCVIAGRPGMGKTVAGLEWAEYAAEVKGRNVAFFSLEMSSQQLVMRLISKRARIDSSRMRRKAGLLDDDWPKITDAQLGIRNLTLAIDDTASIHIDAIRARAARMHAKVKGGLGLIVIDYLQLIQGTSSDGNRNTEITHISRSCKLMAKQIGCPVIGLAQLNRGLEARPDKRPQMSDLRESGAIEQDADVIVFLFRDDYYTKDQCGAPGVAEWIIAKQRQGPTGTAYLNHHLECSYFSDYHGPRPNYAKKKTTAAQEGDDGLEAPPAPTAPRKARQVPVRPNGRDAAAGDLLS